MNGVFIASITKNSHCAYIFSIEGNGTTEMISDEMELT